MTLISPDLHLLIALFVHDKGRPWHCWVLKGSHKVSAFADDLIFVLTDPFASLLKLLQSLQNYGNVFVLAMFVLSAVGGCLHPLSGSRHYA